MAAGSVEATLELWASSLREVKGRIRPLFQQEGMAASAGLFLDALLGPERRKTGWMRAIAAGVPFGWVAADTVYGTGEVEMALRPRTGAGSIVDHLER
jgi:SRSO17 transposase